jgi:hypothetical protein
MTRRVVHEFTCDQPGCREGYAFEGTRVRAERVAAVFGWSVSRRSIWCPGHRTPHARKVARMRAAAIADRRREPAALA